MGSSSKRPHDRAAHILANVILRVCYFFGTALIMFFGVRRYTYLYDEQMAIWHFVAILVASAFIAAIGPTIDQMEAHRGRGSLDEIKRQSRRDGE